MASIQYAPPSEANPEIGIIYPPPEIRHIIDRTAVFVAKNGLDFEYKLKQREIANPRFNFINVNDPYNEYYKYRIREFMVYSGMDTTVNMNKGSGSGPARITIADLLPPSNPPPELEFIADPVTFQAVDIDIIRLTALFVALNGRKFLMNLINREQKNYQFDFLRPQHSNFLYFTKLVEQYTKIILPTTSMIKELDDELSRPNLIMDKVKHRLEWSRFQDREKKREQDIAEKERISYSQIDWHDFVIVDTIEFRPNEKGNLPPPTTPDEVGARILQQERLDKLSTVSAIPVYNNYVNAKISKPKPPHPVIQEDEDDEVYMADLSRIPSEFKNQQLIKKSLEFDEQQAKSEIMQERVDLSGDTVVIRKNYDPKEQRTENVDDSYLVSPFTQEKIPSSNLPKHMKIGLLGSSLKEERDRKLEEKKERPEVYVSGDIIDTSLKNIAERRSDIFGEGDVETSIGKMIDDDSDFVEFPTQSEFEKISQLQGTRQSQTCQRQQIQPSKKPRLE